ncbi:MAG: metallophosphoesterase [Candidatus Riflebacteria bacterium]|nr:metallophosphoesterase [Candidatus Riflebacteria bacterium]
MKIVDQDEVLSDSVQKGYCHILMLADPHFPGRIHEKKKQVLKTASTWNDIDFAAVLGDICDICGDTSEYKASLDFLKLLKKPLIPISGNHDCFFEEGFFPASPDGRTKKIKLFKDTFGLPELYREIKLPWYNLYFLSVDSLNSKYFATISDSQLKWFEEKIKQSRKPSIVFFHAPLLEEKTFRFMPALIDFVAHPHEELSRIVQENPSIIMWVSGHLHIAPENPYFFNEEATKNGKMINILNCDLNGQSIFAGATLHFEFHEKVWTRSLYLYPNKIEAKIFDHISCEWVEKWNRSYLVS